MENVKNSHYDIIIAGCGCAGLSLAWYLTKITDLRFSILMIDKSFASREEKTWCFWDDNLLPDPVEISNVWDVLRFGSETFDRSERLRTFRYSCIDSITYEEKLINALRKKNNIRWVEADIENFRDNDTGAIVETSEGNFEGSKIFQSVIKQASLSDRGDLKQHFIGWKVKTDQALFDSDVATLMDFHVDQKEATAFMYLLPFSSNQALVEYTVFSDKILGKSEYEHEIQSYLEKKFSLSKDRYEIVGMEKGSIPMVENSYRFKSGESVYNIGMISGCSKPTTGYTFSRIHRMSKKIARQLADGEEPDINTISPKRFRFYDILLLDILNENPGASVKIFSQLFRRNSMDSILKFLDEKSGITEDIRLLLSLPWTPFLRALWRSRSKLISGNY